MSGLIQSPLAPAGDQAIALERLFWVMIIVCGLVYLAVSAAVVWSLWRARGRAIERGDDRGLDFGFAISVAAIGVGLSVLIVSSFLADRAVFAARARSAMEIRVTGHQWWWRIEYRDPQTGGWIETANELHLAVGRTARVALGSADVIHSFWVPNVAGKIDMIPGRQNLLDLTPRHLGWFRGQCTEYCGVEHAHMAFDVKVDRPQEFDAWLVAQAKVSASTHGEGRRVGATTFDHKCGACHTVRGTGAEGRAGPDLTHIASRRSIAAGTLPMTRGAIQGWIAQPQAIKPGTAMPAVPLAPAEADAVARYVIGLR